MKLQSGLIVLSLTGIVALSFAGCGDSGGKAAAVKSEKPAHVETKKVGEAALSTITLTPSATERLGIATAETFLGPAPRYYTVAGEIVIPPGQALTVAAPVSGTVSFATAVPAIGSRVPAGSEILRVKPLLPIPRDLRTNAEADVSAALTRLEAAKLRAARAAKLLSDGVGSVRAKEDAGEAVRLAETEVEATRTRLQQIETAPVQSDVSVAVNAPTDGLLREMYTADGQVVSAGAPLFEVARLDPLWVRAPIYSGDLAGIRKGATATVLPIDATPGTKGQSAPPVAAPPTADPLSSASHLYFRLPNAGLSYHPGEKVSVSVPMREEKECLQVPYPAILYDIQGGAWVYEQTAEREYARRRVLLHHVAGDSACLDEGPPPGTLVVTDGAAELFGEEFGVGH